MLYKIVGRIYFAKLRHTVKVLISWAKRSNTPKVSTQASVYLMEKNKCL